MKQHVREDLPDRARIGDQCDEPDVATTPRADPVGRLVSGEHVADAGDAAICTTPDGEPLHTEPTHDTTAHLLGVRGQISLGE
jgi:hypothetical protein